MTRTPDFQSPVWLEASFRHARSYQPDSQLAAELVKGGPEAVASALSTIFASLSNRALREVGDSASRWLTDLALCEQEGELPVDLKTLKVASQVVCDTAANARLARWHCDGTYRRQ
jgi:hypothetical protein